MFGTGELEQIQLTTQSDGLKRHFQFVDYCAVDQVEQCDDVADVRRVCTQAEDAFLDSAVLKFQGKSQKMQFLLNSGPELV